ncbi:MAG TPA: YkgJ family cysteine cluster protein [Pseudolabrys sp.]|jgi:hypothetical protein|nr:YkgJ family cysteine cluster protein [Pseudolabrys sp.]
MKTKTKNLAARRATQAPRDRVVPIHDASVDIRVRQRMETINERFSPHQPEFNERVRDLRDGYGVRSVHETYALLFGLLDDVTSHYGEDVACRRGCNHCCHIAVALTKTEAEVVAARIGVKAEAVPHRAKFGDFPYGYSKPCTFLDAAGECSIYADRPTACRTQYSLAETDQLCALDDDRQGKDDIPYLNLRNFQMLAVEIAMNYADGVPTLGEIRDFFPYGRSVQESIL